MLTQMMLKPVNVFIKVKIIIIIIITQFGVKITISFHDKLI